MGSKSEKSASRADNINQIPGHIRVFACNASRSLAENIAAKLGVKLGAMEVGRFSDGEISTKIKETIRGTDVYIIQSTAPMTQFSQNSLVVSSVNDNLMELLISIDAMRRASVGTINAVIPYFGYARQDRKARARDPISAKLVANLITTAGADRVITMDLHCPQIQGFFDIPVDHLLGIKTFAEYYKKERKTRFDNCVVVSPDLGSVTRARSLAKRIDAPLAIVEKRRMADNVSEVMNIIGDVRDKKVILVDDLIDTAGSITNAAAALAEAGATEVYACCTHPVLSGPAIELIKNSKIKELVVLDTIDLVRSKQLDKIKVLSIAADFADAIQKIHNGESVSEMFL